MQWELGRWVARVGRVVAKGGGGRKRNTTPIFLRVRPVSSSLEVNREVRARVTSTAGRLFVEFQVVWILFLMASLTVEPSSSCRSPRDER